MVQTVQIQLSINSNTMKSQIYINAYVFGPPRYVLWFKDSTHTIYWLTKWLKKCLEQFTKQIKKPKKYRSIGNELSIKGNT